MIKNNTHIILTVLGVVFLLGLFFGVRSYFQWKGDYYFGHVISVTENNFVLSGLRDKEYVVDVGEYTSIKKGFGSEISLVRTGDRVIVVGETSDDVRIKASLIRIMGRTDESVQ